MAEYFRFIYLGLIQLLRVCDIRSERLLWFATARFLAASVTHSLAVRPLILICYRALCFVQAITGFLFYPREFHFWKSVFVHLFLGWELVLRIVALIFPRAEITPNQVI